MLHYNNDRIEYPELWIQDNSDQLDSNHENQIYTKEYGYGFQGGVDDYSWIEHNLVWSNLFPEKAEEVKYQEDMPPHSYPISSNPHIDDCF